MKNSSEIQKDMTKEKIPPPVQDENQVKLWKCSSSWIRIKATSCGLGKELELGLWVPLLQVRGWWKGSNFSKVSCCIFIIAQKYIEIRLWAAWDVKHLPQAW